MTSAISGRFSDIAEKTLQEKIFLCSYSQDTSLQPLMLEWSGGFRLVNNSRYVDIMDEF